MQQLLNLLNFWWIFKQPKGSTKLLLNHLKLISMTFYEVCVMLDERQVAWTKLQLEVSERRSNRNECDLQRAAKRICIQNSSVPEHNCVELNEVCEFCGALFWNSERNASRTYTQCCHSGKVRLTQIVIEAKRIDSENTKTIFIPRLPLIPSDSNMPFKFKRRQFPIRLTFAKTINKSQRQTFEKICLLLPKPLFCHG